MNYSVLCAMSAISLLAACGGGSTGGGSMQEMQEPEDMTEMEGMEETSMPVGVTLADLIARGTALETSFDTFDSEEFVLTPDEALPPGGNATFTGIAIAFRDSEDFEVDGSLFGAVGQASLMVNIDAGTVSGTADNFFALDDPDIEDIRDSTGEAIDGSATFSLTQETDGENLFLGTVTGSLIEGSGAELSLNLPAGGGFIGDAGEGFAIEAFEEDGLVGVGVIAGQVE